jgi:hypothetical protein
MYSVKQINKLCHYYVILSIIIDDQLPVGLRSIPITERVRTIIPAFDQYFCPLQYPPKKPGTSVHLSKMCIKSFTVMKI